LGFALRHRGDNLSITASANLGWSGTDELPANRAWSIGAQLNVPVFNGHLTRQQTAEAEALVAMLDAAEQRAASEKAQLQMTTAETNLVRVRFDQATALAALYRALGRLPQPGSQQTVEKDSSAALRRGASRRAMDRSVVTG